MTEPRTPSGRGLVRWLMTYGPVDPQDPDAVARSVVEIERQARLPAYSPTPVHETDLLHHPGECDVCDRWRTFP